MIGKPKTKGSLIPWAIVAFFVVVAIVNFIFAYAAFETHPGLEADNPYLKGLEYNRVIADDEAENRLGWSGQVTLDPAKDGAVEVSITDQNGAPVTGLTVTATAFYPVKEGFDRTVTFKEEGGVYVATPDLPLAGQWEFRVSAVAPDGKEFHFARRVVL